MGDPANHPNRWAWIYDVRRDLAISLGWLPVFVVAAAVVERAELDGTDLLAPLVALTLFASALHQPLTLGLVYGDPQQRARHRRLFLWAPPIVVVAVLGASSVAPMLVVAVAAVWNTVHTLQQRYGISRIYARRSGYGSARIDRALLYGALGVAVLVVASRPGLSDLVRRADLGGRNGQAVDQLAGFQDVAGALVLPALVVFGVVALAAVRVEQRAGAAANRARQLYLVSSVALIGSIVVLPAAGFVAYLAAHTIEYVIVVHSTAVRRGADPTAHGAIRATKGSTVGVAVAMLLVMAPVALAHVVLPLRTLSLMLACVGALHFLYDGFIWKLRKPAVAREFALSS